MSTEPRRYVVLLDATSAARLPPDGVIAEEGEGYSFKFAITTVYEDLGLDTPLPRDFRVFAEIQHHRLSARARSIELQAPPAVSRVSNGNTVS